MRIIFIISIIIVFGVLLLLFIPCFANKSKKNNLPTVKNVDINKYLGVWYEIARFPHKFEKDLVGVTATYSLKDNGEILVVNQGYKYTLDGKHKIANGRARIPNPNETGYLQVSFFLCFWADYLILELDEDYQYALVGSSSNDFLWILSRSPILDDAIFEKLLKTAKELGYNIDKLELVEQKK